MGIDKRKAEYYYELAAMSGSIRARFNLGAKEYNLRNYQRAFKHFMLAARAGHKPSLIQVGKGYTEGHVTKEQWIDTLQEYQKSQDEMKSNARDKARAVRNSIG